MSYNIFISDDFNKQIKRLSKKYPSIKSDISNLIDKLEINPIQGEPLGKDCFKIRLNIKSKRSGKSGGGRVITCVKIIKSVVYLLAIYDKSEKETLNDKELDELLKIIGLV